MNICKKCNSKINIEYKYLGLKINCPNCDSLFELGTENYTPSSLTGYEITFRNFKQLINDNKSNKKIILLIEKIFDYKTIELKNNYVAFVNHENELIPLEFLHVSIQNNRRNQKSIYQEAMNIWR